MEGGCFGVRRTSLALPLLVRSWSFMLGASWSYLSNRMIYFADRRIVGQSSAEACSQVSCSPGDWPDDVVQKLAGINQHHVWSTWSHDRDTERLDEHRLVTLPQAAVLNDQGRRDWTQFKLEDIGYIKLRCCPTTNSRLNSVSMS